jgi:hypothetical protein
LPPCNEPQIKTSGDNAMYPRPYLELSGWTPRVFTAGAATFAVCAETSTITWGGASYGELGYGAGGKKSSANPEKVPSLEGLKVLSVACGAGHTVFLLDAATPADAMAKLPLWSPPADAPPADVEGGAGSGGAGGKAPRKRKPAGEAAGGAKKGK